MRKNCFDLALVIIIGSGLAAETKGDVLIFSTAWGNTNAVQNDPENNAVQATNRSDSNVGVSKFNPAWGTLNSVLAEASYTFNYQMLSQPVGEWHAGALVSVGGLTDGGNLDWEDNQGTLIEGDGESTILVSDVIGIGIVEIPVVGSPGTELEFAL